MTPAIEAALVSAAASLGVPSDWLRAQISAESGWKPAAYNASTGATGLLQWIPRTMKDFGFLPAQVAAKIPARGDVPTAVEKEASREFLNRYPDAVTQLKGPVLTYLRRYAPFPTEQSLYLAVFYPAYRGKTLTTPFPDSVRAVNPGIDTVGDYVAFVRRKSQGGVSGAAGTTIAGIATAAAAAFFAFR